MTEGPVSVFVLLLVVLLRIKVTAQHEAVIREVSALRAQIAATPKFECRALVPVLQMSDQHPTRTRL